MFALSQDGRIVSKPRPTRDAVAEDARIKNLFVELPARVAFKRQDAAPVMLAPGVQIVDLDP